LRGLARPLPKWQVAGMTKPAPMPDLMLGARTSLPAEFQLILADYPRNRWPDHADFNGLAAFWLDRHLSFRTMMTQLQDDAQGLLDGKLAQNAYARRLSQLGSRFLGDLTGHHQIEDDVYFPQLARLEPRIAQGFDMLDADHHALHALIDRFVTGANAVLAAKPAAQRGKLGRFSDDLSDFARLLDRHLLDEEDLVLPVVLKHRVG
jgi:iron-sulfur cluster repair protein YtfE (RIC family)